MKKQSWKVPIGYVDKTKLDYIPQTDKVDNFVFYAELEFIDVPYSRYNSFRLQDIHTKRRYTLFASNFLNLIHDNIINNGIVKGYFKFCKRGQEIGIIKTTKDGK